MADIAASQDAIPARKRSKLPLVLGLVLGLVGGAGGFYAAFSGLLPVSGTSHTDTVPSALPDIAYVALDPIIVTLAPAARSRHLRFAAQLEVPSAYRTDVEKLRPRILDLLNGYLRAIQPAEFENPSTLIRLRAQMLRRIQIVTGEGRVRDLLITEFVLN